MDNNKFINTYIDIVVNTVLEYVKSNLQLQTQLKVHEFLVTEKDQIIENLTQQLADNRVAEDWKMRYESAETNYAAIQSKLKHMDTLLSQVSEMKKTIFVKDEQIVELNRQIEKLKGSKKVINTKKKEENSVLVQEEKTEKTLDDF